MRRGFSLIELIFVIVVIGILAKFGTNLMMTVYRAYTASTINNRLQVDAELALKQVSNRLQYRIKDSIIARTPGVGFTALSSAGGGETVLEWIGYDIDGWLGLNNIGPGVFNPPTWSGFIDIDAAATVAGRPHVESPGSDTTDIDIVIQAIRPNASTTTIADAAIFFTGANSDIQTDYGWNGALLNQNGAAHPIQAGVAVDQLAASVTNFSNIDIYENYKLAWTAYAISIEDDDGDGDDDLVLYYDYQPWAGEGFANGSSVLLLPNVDTFKFSAVGDTVKVQICVNEHNTLGEGQYSICKETAIF